MPGELKEVAIEDLLNRKPVTPDWRLIRDWLTNKTVMVTGAGSRSVRKSAASARATARVGSCCWKSTSWRY